MLAEHVAHHVNQLQSSGVAYPVKHSVGILTGGQNTLVAQYGKMLGDVALGSANVLHDILYAYLLVAQGAENFQSKGVRHGFEGAGGPFYILIPIQECDAALRMDAPHALKGLFGATEFLIHVSKSYFKETLYNNTLFY